MSGGIIIQRLAVLKPAAQAPSIYNYLPNPTSTTPNPNQTRVDAICAKAPGLVTQEDIQFLGTMVMLGSHC
jgi:hypothetical protein